MNRLLASLAALVVLSVPAWADVAELIKKLDDKDNEVRRAAAKELSESGKDAKPAVKALAKRLKDKDLYVRRYSAQALGNIGPDAREAIPALSAALNDDKPQVRQAAVQALARLGSAAVPALTRAMRTGTGDIQEQAVAALGKAGKAGLPALRELIASPKMDAGLRRRGIEAVVALGSEGHDAVTALVTAFKDAKARGRDARLMRLDAAAALGRLATSEDEGAVKALDAVVQDAKLRDNGLKNAAKRALAQIRKRQG
jgi:HEAT repeat protein